MLLLTMTFKLYFLIYPFINKLFSISVIQRHTVRTPSVVVWGTILYHGRSQTSRTVDNLSSNQYTIEVLVPEVITFFQRIPEALFQQDVGLSHIAKNVKVLFLARQKLLLWPPIHMPLCSDMSTI